jgi:hypothetical protein
VTTILLAASGDHRNYPALITSTVLAVVVVFLLLWRRRQLRDRRRPRDP